MKRTFTLLLSTVLSFSAFAQNGITITPDFAYQGDLVPVTIMGQTPLNTGTSIGTQIAILEQGTSTTLYPQNTLLLDSVTLSATYDLSPTVDTGYYDLSVYTSNNYYFLPNAFFINTNLNGNINLGGTVFSGTPKTGNLTVDGLKLTLLTPFNNVRLITRTDANGLYEFKHLPDGTYTINAEGVDNSNAPTFTISSSSANVNKDLYVTGGNQLISGIKDVVLDQSLFTLSPSVFNNNVKMGYSLAEAANVEVNVYDMTGKLLLNKNLGKQPIGKYSYNVNMEGIQASGVYLFEIKANGQSFVKKAVKGN